MRAPVLDAIGGRLELRLNSPVDSAIDRRRAAVIRVDQPGRGLHPSGLLFQVAAPRLDGRATTEHVSGHHVAADHIAARWPGATRRRCCCCRRTCRSPNRVARPARRRRAPRRPVGVAEQGMAPWRFDLTGSEPHSMIYGDCESGKTTFLRRGCRRWRRAVPARRRAGGARRLPPHAPEAVSSTTRTCRPTPHPSRRRAT